MVHFCQWDFNQHVEIQFIKPPITIGDKVLSTRENVMDPSVVCPLFLFEIMNSLRLNWWCEQILNPRSLAHHVFLLWATPFFTREPSRLIPLPLLVCALCCKCPYYSAKSTRMRARAYRHTRRHTPAQAHTHARTQNYAILGFRSLFSFKKGINKKDLLFLILFLS